MGAVAGLFGNAGGAGGTGFSSPSLGGLANPDQQAQTYNQLQSGFGTQEQLLNALQAQNGIQNQSAVYQQLQNVATGQGPNPAQAMLSQQTGQNVANQAAMAAGQRGAGANVGMLARQAGQTGGALQQQAVGQGATMQAQQSLNAIGQAGQMATTQAGQQIGQANANVSAIQNLANTQAGIQANVNSSNAALAGTKMIQQGDLLGGGIGGASAAAVAAAEGGRVESLPKMWGGGNTPSLGVDTTLPPIDSSLTAPKMAPGSSSSPQSSFSQFISTQKGMSAAGAAAGYGLEKGISAGFSGLKSLFSSSPTAKTVADQPAQADSGDHQYMTNEAKGGKVKGKPVPAMVSPDEIYMSPSAVEHFRRAADKKKVIAKEGQRIPGKAKVKGDSTKNDTVRKTLETGGVVVKRTEATDLAKAASFIMRSLRKPR